MFVNLGNQTLHTTTHLIISAMACECRDCSPINDIALRACLVMLMPFLFRRSSSSFDIFETLKLVLMGTF